jgi:alpha-glucosidase
MTSKRPWWRGASIYQVYPRSFRDGNGDGRGDLRGIIERLDYIAALGADALWISPFYPSPQHDSGYDISDPRNVDPMYGTLADAEELLDQAHARGLRVIIDVVPNHVSTAHPWFTRALASPPGSPARDHFHFLDGKGKDGEEPPNNWESVFGGPAWTRVKDRAGNPEQWYLHLFDSSQPDLNWEHDGVRDYWLDTLRMWLDLGVDGLRVDAASALAKDMSYPDLDEPAGLVRGVRLDLDDGSDEARRLRTLVPNSAIFDRDEVHDIYREWRELLDSYPGDRMSVAEAWVPEHRTGRYVAEDSLHQIFGFDFLVVPWSAPFIRKTIRSMALGVADSGALPTWALSNHDTQRLVSRFGGGPRGLARARALALLTQALPGAVYVFQGEELGLEDVDLPMAVRQDPIVIRTGGHELGRDGCRVPLPWSGEFPPYGFTNGPVTELWLPQPMDWAHLTISAQERDPHSTLAQYREALHLRRSLPGLARDDFWELVDIDDDAVAIRRGSGFVCVLNASTHPIAVEGTVLVASNPDHIPALQSGELAPDSAVWLQT